MAAILKNHPYLGKTAISGLPPKPIFFVILKTVSVPNFMLLTENEQFGLNFSHICPTMAHAHAINAFFSRVGPSPPERSEERRKNGA